MANSAILDACSKGKWDQAETLFDADPSAAVAYRDRQDWTLLHEATNSKAPKSFIWKLLAFGMDPNKKNSAQRTPLHYALQQSVSPDLLEMLLQAGADPNAADKLGKTPVHWAILENVPPSILRTLLKYGGDLNRRDLDGRTALHLAVEQGDASMALIRELLKDNRADTNIPDSAGKTALHLAILSKRSIETIQELLRHGADVNRTDAEGATSLYHAVYVNARPSMLKVLLEAGGWMDRRRWGVARFHGNPILCAQIEKARLLIALCSATMIRRIGRNSPVRSLSTDLIRKLSQMLYRPFSDDLLVDEDAELGGEQENENEE